MKLLKEKKKILGLSELYEKYSKDIFRYSFSILKSGEDAKDATQEVFAQYARNESSFKGECDYKTWLLVLTRNYCYNKIKSKNFNNERIEKNVLRISYEMDYDARISIEEALLELSAEQNELIYLREYEGYSYKEIAEITEQTLENVKVKIFRARKTLADYLEIKNRAKTYYTEMNTETDDAKIIGAILPHKDEKKKYKLPFYISAAAAVLLAFLLWFGTAERSAGSRQYEALQAKYISLQKEYIAALNEKIELAKMNENLSEKIAKGKIERVAAERKIIPKKRKQKTKEKQQRSTKPYFSRQKSYAANVAIFTITKDDFLGRQIVGN